MSVTTVDSVLLQNKQNKQMEVLRLICRTAKPRSVREDISPAKIKHGVRESTCFVGKERPLSKKEF